MKIFNKRLNFLVITLIFSLNTFSQQEEDILLNQEFLDSLPEDTKADLVEQLEKDKDKLKEVDYGIFNSMMSKSSAERFIDQELLRSEVEINPEDMTLDDLEIFGRDFFTGYPSTFSPVSEPSLSYTYILDLGDKLDVEIFGAHTFSGVTIISTDGSIMVGGIGNIQIAGLTLGEATRKISEVVSFKYPGAQTSIKLNSLRNMQIVVVGFVDVPGIYTLPGNASVLSALRLAGGISEQGSFRNIEIRRNGFLIGNFDLYNLLINGDNQFNKTLRSGDSVIVRAAGKMVSIYGGVPNPAIYEIVDENIADAIFLAGGPLNGAEISEITLSSLEDSKRVTKSVPKNSFNKIIPSNDSFIYVPYKREVKTDSIELIGSFVSPGLYSIDNLANFLSAEKLSQEAYTNAVILMRSKSDSNSFDYSFHNPKNKLNLNQGDKLVALSNEDIEFINSNLMRDYFNQSNDEDYNPPECEVFEYMSNIKNTNRYQRIKEFYTNNTETIELQDNEDNLTDLGLASLNSVGSLNPNSGLFINKNISDCPKIFERDPDLLFSVIQNSIYIDGPNVRGGIFPIFDKINLKKIIDSISFFGGQSSNDIISLSTDNNINTISIDSSQNYQVSLGSNITISSTSTSDVNRVKISGEVNKPGYYYVSKNERLSSLLDKAGDYTESAYPIGGTLLRRSAKQLEIDYNEKLYAQIIKNLSTEIVTGNNVPFQTISFILNEFRSIQPNGRVITQFNKPIIKSDKSQDIILENGDEIFIPKRSNIVYVFGEVLNPGPQVFSTSNSLNDYVKSAGGYTNLVDDTSIILVYPDGKSKLINKSIFSFSNDDVLPGSVIYASRDLRKLDNLRLASTLAPIVSSIAISLASLNSISND